MTFRNTSVIDYLVSSIKGFDQVQEFKIQELDSLFSDGHTLKHFKLTTKLQDKLTTKYNKKQTEHWNEDTKQTYKNNISDNDIATIQCELNNPYKSIDNVSTRSNLAKAVDILSQIYIKSAEKTFPQKKVSFNVKTLNKPWYGINCKNAKKVYNKARRNYIKNPSIMTKNELKQKSKVYKKIINKYIKIYNNKTQKNLRSLHTNKPKDYWKYLNSLNDQDSGEKPSLES